MLPTALVSPTPFTIRCGEAGYPPQLLATPRPPRLLNGFGDPATLQSGLAVIGSRKASPYGLECVRMFAGAAASWGVTIVSGGATGCDLAAHSAALEVGAPTVAVLGCGADVDYPRSAALVLRRLRCGEGAVVSELDWGAPPLRRHFPARNRIIAGLSAAVLVVEAALPSGTFSTADHALDAGRDVLAVPGSIMFAGSAGCNRLIRQGAAPITCEDDLRDALASCGLLASRGAKTDGSMPLASGDVVLEALRANPMAPDRIADAAGLDVIAVMTRLALLEQQRLIARYPDGRYGPLSPD